MALSQQLEDARARRVRLFEAGIATQDLDREILALRRQLREGGQLLAGDALGDGRYLLVKPVGRGGFAVVWEAYDKPTHQTVAIKVLHAHLAGDPLRRERFFRGARAMMTLARPDVVRVLEPEQEDGGFHYFVMELVSGGNLNEAVLKGRVDKTTAFVLVLQVCEAVAAAHAKGMVHRDIKPSNILLDGNDDPKLTDFDLVGAVDTTGGTRTGALGTLLYSAPECLDRPQDATPRADVYGLGMTAIFCLSGQELPRSILRTPEPTIAKLSCSRAFRAVLTRAVAWEPEERFAEARAMGIALREALSRSERALALLLGIPDIDYRYPDTSDDTAQRESYQMRIMSASRPPAGKPVILFLAANPLGTDRLALDQEARAIQLELERSGHADRFELVMRWAAEPLDLLVGLRKLRPTVVHFTGHGTENGLYFQDSEGGPKLVSTAQLQEAFRMEGSSVRLVVLNAGHSDAHAEALVAHVDCVVGIRGTIRDGAARNFAIGLYGGLAEGESVAAAYRQGRHAISLEGLPDADQPQLKVRPGVDADQLVLIMEHPSRPIPAPSASRSP